MKILSQEEYLKYKSERKKKSIEEKIKSGTPLTQEEYREYKGLSPISYNEDEEEEEKKKDTNKWFKGGAFEDGYQFGDLTKTTLGTVGDVTVNVGKGILGLVEGVTDLAQYGAMGITSLYDKEKAQKIKQSAMESWTDNLLGGLEKGVDKYSVFGDKADNIAQGIGYVGGILATGGVAGATAGASAGASALIPTLATSSVTFASSMGSGMGEAYQSGASDMDATTYGLIKGVSDTVSEFIFAGLGKSVNALGLSTGLSQADDILAKKLTEKITNQVAKNVVQFGVKASAEGLEEVVAGIGSAIGKKVTYLEDEEWGKIIEDEQLLDQFIAGAITSGFAQSGYIPGMTQGSLREANKTGRDFISGYTQNEQSIVDKVTQQQIEQQERESGKKLTKKEQNSIKEEVETMLKRGEIDIDTIESTFGGNSYTAYDSLRKESEEFDTLYKTKKGELSREQEVRLEELEAKNKERSYSDRLIEARQRLTLDVDNATQNDTYLRESFAEKGRRSEAFKLSEEEKAKYTEEELKIVNKAVEMGEINNTRKAHEMVDFVAKVSTKLGVDFDFMNNKKLAEAGYIVEGKTIDGFKKGNAIAVNLQSKKALNSVVGHEITHVLEGTQLYDALQTTLKEYATTKGVYQSLFDTAKENYRNVYTDMTEDEYNAKVEQEVTSDLVGEYIFSDMDFVRNLSTKNPNVFQKVFNEIKYMLKVATAGSDAEKQLLKAKKIFEDVYRDTKRNTSEDVQYALQNVNINKDTKIPIVESTDYTVVPVNDYNTLHTLQEDVKKLKRDTYENKASGYKADINAKTISKILHPTSKFNPWHGHYIDNLNASKHLPELFENAVYVDTKENQKSKNANKEVEGFHHFVAPIRMNGNDYRVRITAREKANSNTLYIVDAEVLQNNKGNVVPNANANGNISTLPSEMSIADLVNGVNIFDYNLQKNQSYTDKDIQFSITDNKGNTLTEAQQERNKNSKLRDENGNLKLMYHGTQNDFTIFDPMLQGGKNGVAEGYGIYFSDNEKVADNYGGKKMSGYVNITHPATTYEKTINKNELVNLIKATTEIEAKEYVDDGEYDNLQDALKDTWVSNYVYTYEMSMDEAYKEVADIIINGNGNDMHIIQEVMLGIGVRDYESAYKFYDTLRSTIGIDGFITEWVDSNTNEKSEIAVAFDSNQFKSITNQNPTDNPDINLSLTDNNQDIAPTTNGIYGEDIQLEQPIAQPQTHENARETHDIAPSMEQMKQLENEAYNELFAPVTEEEANAMLDSEENWERMRSLQEADEMDDIAPPIYSSDTSKLSDEDLREVRKGIKDTLPLKRGRTQEFNDILQRYSTSEFPSRDALFQEIKDKFGKVTVTEEISDVVEAQKMLRSTRINVSDSIKKGVTDYVQTMRRNFGKIRFAKDGMPVDVVYQELSEMYPNMFPDDIANEIDQFEQLLSVANMMRTETGEFTIDDATINETVNSIMTSIRDVKQRHAQNTAERRARWFDKDRTLEEYMQTDDYEALTGNPNLLKVFHERWDRNRLGTEAPLVDETVAQIRDSEPEAQKKGFKENIKRKWAVFKANFVDKGAVFEDLAKTTKNRNLEAKWDYTMLAEAQAQYHMQHGDENVKSLDAIREEVDNTGYSKEFSEYMYHSLNIDRMTLDERYGIENKAVFGKTITAGVSQQKVAELESAHPEFKAYAQDVYDYMSNLRERMVANGILSQETADLWSEMYPHYVPIRRVDSKGLNVNVPLATDRTGVNAPIKRATGGSSDILPLFDTIGQRTMQTFKAINKNDFGIELKNTLGSTISRQNQGVDNAIDMVEMQEDLLQAGENGYNPTFTVFENGERVEFEITQEMYEALLPMSDKMRDSGSKILQKASSFHRGVLTEYNPVFALTNGIKDMQDILMNSQHPAKTYAKIVEATQQLLNKGQWYQEYMKNGGENNSYFDTETNTIAPTKKGILDTFPLKQISNLNNFIERVPRLAEYIASREMGRSVQESMLDSARVTTNFKAGGDVTKFLNRNGATFLNASVQGVSQQVRNVREANMNGLKGWGMLATKFAVAGLPALLLNNLLWDDDEEYEELSDYVKQNYYVVGKYGDGQFIRIPKGRTVAVIQEAFNQMDKLATGDDSADLNTFLEVLTNNLAPNNPISNNVVAPLVQAVTNKTWYGEDLVPQRLQDSPSAEQYDESTDSISKAIGQALNISPMKVNYVLDQYTGLVGDMILPALTPEVTNESEKPIDYLIAPLKDKFTTDGVMNKQVITDFYNKSEELTKTANKPTATSEDILRNKYLNSVKAEMNDLYKLKREVQNSDLPNKEKYAQVRDIQRQISELANEGMSNYENAEVYDYYGRVNDRHFHLNEEGEWKKVNDKQLEKQTKVTSTLGISANDYWSRKEEYDYAYDYPGKYAIAKAVGGYDSYVSYSKELNNIEGTKNILGETINGTRKAKVVNYLNNLNADYYTKIMLFKKEYPGDDRYNYEIVEYLNSRDDISYQEMVDILTELDFKVSEDGTIRW